MSLTRTARQRNKKAHALTDPQPRFISLVKAGANKTPFVAVRSATLVGKEAEDFLMTVKKSDIAKLTFKSASFADEAAVKAWLDQGGYEGFEIAAKDDGFEVIGDESLTDIRRIETDAGVVVYVGTKAAAEGEASEEESAEAAAETAAKGAAESKAAVVSAAKGESEEEPKPNEAAEAAPAAEGKPAETAEKTETSVIVEGAITATNITVGKIETVQPVAQPVDVPAAVEAAKSVIGKLVETGVQVPSRKAGLYTVQELASVLSTLTWMLNDAEWNGFEDAEVTAIKEAGATLLTVLVSAMQSLINKHVDTFVAQKAEAEARAKAEAENPAIAALKASLEQSMATMQAQLTQLTADNAALKTAKEAADSKAAEAETRAKAAEEARRPTRKGADVGDSQTTASNEKPAAKADHELTDSEWVERRLRSDTFGCIA